MEITLERQSVTAQLTPDQVRLLDRVATEEQCSRSDVLRKAVRAWMAQQPQKEAATS